MTDTTNISTAGSNAAPKVDNGDSPRGFAFALTAYLMWGILPLYLKLVEHLPALEVIAERIIWSVPFAGVILLIIGKTDELKAAFRSPRTLGMIALSSVFISLNWGVYVWSIINDHAIDAALGYFINPLFSIALAAIVLKEKLARGQIIAIGLAVLAVVILTVQAGRLPIVALALPFAWGIYALLRKTVPMEPNQGFTLEVILLSIPCGLYILFLEVTGRGHFFDGTWRDPLLFIGCGAVTAIPLIIYANGAKLLRLSTIGIMQYIVPTGVFLIAVFIFQEPFGMTKLFAFMLIWAALVIYTISTLRAAHDRKSHRR
ncbi:EamA family transporter RarD [Martelella alba]|uniref:EamA family transporter RarD n=1 Tax=Martelella alba TaxID=2590451 RepID=A0A506UJB5_9HYPH|nr:EamA family transporter RarD [Martelella alba]TPW33424.1 EamA family transporter RarD [Martelella alba]